VVLALATTAGAFVAWGAPVWIGALLIAVALGTRRPGLLCLGAALTASALGARSWSGLTEPEPGPIRGVATLVSDPEDFDGAIRLELRVGGRRFEAWARDRPAARLRDRLAGERVVIVGRIGPLSPPRRAYLARRHIVARITVNEVGRWSDGGSVARLANGLRRVLLDGTESIPERERALFAGLVLGDDRAQDPATIEDFRAAGLTHLLAVSGQNVAFVLALVAPVLRGFGLRGRLVGGLGVLVLFGVMTRWEPSVLRAAAMAGVTMVAVTAGRPVSTLRVLALAVTGLLLVDPLLVGSVGFLLSCGACAGIALLAKPLSRRMPLALAVTLAAQIGVAPVLLPVFGTMPVASLPANLLAVPAAAPVVAWGLAAGLPAGLVGGVVAQVVHLPTRVLVGWIGGVARWAAALPLGQLRVHHVIVIAAAVTAGVLVRRLRTPATVLALAVGILGPATAGVARADGRSLTAGVRLWHHDRASVMVVDRPPRTGSLLSALRDANVGDIAMVVVTGAAEEPPPSLQAVLARHPTRMVLTARGAVAGSSWRVGGVVVRVTAVRPGLSVDVKLASP